MKRPIFRRVIDIRTVGDGLNGEARVALEDDYHHFRVQLIFAQGKVTQASGIAIRTPYTACRDATLQLSQLEGMHLDTGCSEFTDPRMQCTHMLDEAGLGIACAVRCINSRRYDIAVPRHIDGVTQASLHRDAVPVLSWHIKDGCIAAPAHFAGLSISRGFARWSADNLDHEAREAALVLRRCAMISLGRLRNLDIERHARPTGHCFAQQPGRADEALRIVGSTEDYSDRSEQLCGSDQTWLDELLDDQ